MGQKAEWWFPGAGGEGEMGQNRAILLNEYKVSAGEDENVLEMDDDNSCPTM